MTTADRPEEKGFDLEAYREEVEDTVANIMINDGPDGHCDGYEIIAQYALEFGRRCFDQGIERAAGVMVKQWTSPTTALLAKAISEEILALKGGEGKG